MSSSVLAAPTSDAAGPQAVPVQEVRLDPPLLDAPAVAPSPPAALRGDRALADQLARIEEKAARLEEKFARTETMVGRFDAKVDAFASHAGELARAEEIRTLQAEVAAIRRRVRGVPGYGALFFSIVVTAILTAGLLYLLQRYVTGALPAASAPSIGTPAPVTQPPASPPAPQGAPR